MPDSLDMESTSVRDGVHGVETAQSNSMSKEDIKHNVKVCVMMDVIWGIGATEMAVAANPMLVWLGASNAVIGLVTQSFAFMGLLGVILSPFITKRFKVKKWYLLVVHIPYLATWGLIGMGLVFSQTLGLSKQWLLSMVMILTAANWFFGGFVTLPHNEYIAGCVPMSHRGRFAGYSYSVGSGAGLASNALAGWILLRVLKPAAFGYLYIMTWLICQSGYILALFGRERPSPVEKSPNPWSKQMIKAAVSDKPYMRVMALYALYTMIFIPVVTVFYSAYGFRDLRMDAAHSASIGMAQKVATLLLGLVLGRLIDKYSPKRFLAYWPIVIVAAILPMLILRNIYGVYICGVIGMIFFCGQLASFNALIYGLPSPENRAGHYTFQILIAYLSMSVGPVFVGALCDKFGYISTFGAVALLALAAVPYSRYLLSTLSDKPADYS
jgi:MFS family permease